jgi:hypothetical protein
MGERQEVIEKEIQTNEESVSQQVSDIQNCDIGGK